MRLIKIMLLVVAMACLGTPAWGAPPPPPSPSAGWSGWSFTGTRLVWRAPDQVPVGDAAIEFWDGDRLLGLPRPSTDHRTFTLDSSTVTGTRALSVRAGGRRLDAEEQRPPLRSQPPPVPVAQPAGAVDPGAPGRFSTRTGEYTVDSVVLPGYPAPIEMHAVVVAPVNAPGHRPLALFLHGRHFTCYDAADPDNITLEWPCPAGMKAVPSHRGYLQAQQLLASQGYVTVSISANGVNAQDAVLADAGAQGRSSLVRQHLARWANWAGAGRGSAPAIVRAAPVADLSRVLLVGHSRGGEGVNRAALDSLSPPPGDSGYSGPVRWTVRGTLLIGPTIFGHNPAPDVPSATILPGCDGDVSDLQGEMYLDATRGVSRGAAVHSALYVVGANHNFFNTEWTPGQSEAPAFDDVWSDDDAVCSPGTPTRLTAAQQQTAGATYIAAAARLFVAGDRRVLPLVDGSGVRAPSADPARVLSHAVGGARTPFVVPDAATTVSGDARLCKEATQDAASACADPATSPWQPHFVTLYPVREDPDRFAVTLSGSGVIRPAKAVSLAGKHSLALRVIVPPNSTGNRFDVAITDTHGRKARLGSVSLDGLPATEQNSALWAQEVRVPLPRHGIDLSAVAALELVGGGQAWLIDAYGWSSGLPDPRPVTLPRVDVGAMTVAEGDAGTRTYQIPVSVSGNSKGTVRLFVSDEHDEITTRLITVQPGQHTIEFPFEVTGNTRWSTESNRWVLAKAVQGTVSGGYVGGLTVLNDDPEPTITITPVADEVAEGGVLTWTVTSSAVADSPLVRFIWPIPLDSGPELSSTDVDPNWFRERTYGGDPEPTRPLSMTRLDLSIAIEPGTLTTEITIPTVTDNEAEQTEYVRLYVMARETPGADEEIIGAVTDKP
jgi:hypothetical protein